MPPTNIEGESVLEKQGIISRASFRRQPRSGQKFFTVMSLDINNNYAKKRGIGKKLLFTIRAIMLEEHVDLVAGDFKGAAWRRATSANSMAPHGNDTQPTPLWVPGAVPGEWTDVCGFVKPPNSCDKWKVRLHGAFTIPRGTLGLRPRDQSCHHEVWLHLDFLLTTSVFTHDPGHPYQLYDAQKGFGEEVHRAPITEVGDTAHRILKYQRRPLSIADVFRRFRGKHCRF